MGTFFELHLAGPDIEHLEAVLTLACEEILRLEMLMSCYHPAAELYRVNTRAAQRPVKMDKELFSLIEHALSWYTQTGGFFDIAYESAPGRTRPLHELIELDPQRVCMQFHSPEIRLDLGGYGKGYAIRQVAQLLTQWQVGHFCLHGGTSSAFACGTRADGRPWTVKTRSPFDKEGEAQTWELSGRGFACSQGSFEGQLQACLAFSPDPLKAEILTTTFMQMGLIQSRTWTHQQDLPIEAYWANPGEPNYRPLNAFT